VRTGFTAFTGRASERAAFAALHPVHPVFFPPVAALPAILDKAFKGEL
jgi:hypothetical protein